MGIYEELGITPFINAYRPLTRLGGATMPQCVIDAMREASQKSVNLRLMQQKVGEAIASLTNNEAAYVSCGAASGITLAIAGCMAGTDPLLSDQLPDAIGMKNKVIMQSCERGYKSDVAIRCAGASIINVGNCSGASGRDLRNAIDEQTAAIFAHDSPQRGQVPLKDVIAIGRERKVPVLIDAAFSVPPADSLWKFTRNMGADAVFISGGKGLRGPQSTGLVLGRPWVVKACAFQGVPNDRLGRGMKVGKEELAGIYAAVKHFMGQNEEVMRGTMLRQLDHIISSVASAPNVTVRRLGGTMAMIAFDRKSSSFTPVSACQWLLNSAPSVYLEPAVDGLIVSTECLGQGDEEIVSEQLRKLFNIV
jgi:uncharacterized pyridoxal phosphate-dependent enzyme